MYNCVVVDCAYDVVLQFRQQILTPLPPTLLGYACDHCVELTSDSLSEHAVNKQLADKERVRAALENEHLLGVVDRCIEGGMNMQ